jgi:tripartite ATP-independent transporter DctM subunit
VIALSFLVLVGALAIGLPIAATLILVSLMGILDGGLPVTLAAQRIYTGLDNFPLLAAPLFILAGAIMETGGMSARIVGVAQAMVGHVRGGLAQVVIVATLLFSGVSGSSTADTAAVGGVMLPEMKRRGYPVEFSTAVVAAAGGMGLLIPPSIILLIYGFLSSTSITALFIGGIIPGMLICACGMVAVYFMAGRYDIPAVSSFSAPGLWQALKDASWALMMPLIILIGIRFGVVTITEAAALAVVYGLFVSMVIHRELKFSDMPRVFAESGLVSGLVMVVVGTASLFAWYLTSQQVPRFITQYLVSITDEKVIILLLLNVVFLLVGCVFEVTAALIMAVPIVLPLTKAYGIDPVHLGIIIAANMGIGLVTPPVGICLYVACGISRIPIERTLLPLLPLLIAMIIGLLIVTYVPEITLFLPRLLADHQ